MKSTEIVQLAFVVSDDSQVTFVLANSVAFVPVMLTEEMLSAELPVFVNVTVCAPLVVPSG